MPSSKPNFLIFMTDQQRGATVLPGHPARTPRLDAFRREALAFDNTFAPSPHCCPSRATFFTGLYPSQHGVWNNVCVRNAHAHGPKEDVPLWSEDLAAAGYQLDFDGKWHVSWEKGPEDYGFRRGHVTADARKHGQGVMGADWPEYEQIGCQRAGERRPGEILRPGWGDYRHYGLDEDPFGDAAVVRSATETLGARSGDQPWCHFVGTLGPHDPYFVPQAFLDLYDPQAIRLPDNFHDRMEDKPGLYRRTRGVFDQLTEAEHREAIRHYLALCSYEDHLFGQLLDALEASGQAEDTIVLYLSDHGDYLGEHGLWCKGLPCFRGAYEVPLLIRAPGRLAQPGRSSEAFVSLADLGPTFLELAGVEASRPFTGCSLAPFLRDEPPADWRDAIFTQSNGNELYGIQRSVTTEDWKLVYNGFDFDELYDLRTDPGETRNLAADPAHRDTLRTLYRRLWRFARETDDAAINNYIMVGLADCGPGCS